MKSTKIYRYVHAHDTGMAPNPRHGQLTLATCKPGIRAVASVGDWVVGCFPSPLNKLVSWAGRVSETIPVGEYSKFHPQREDAIYRVSEKGALERRPGFNVGYHEPVQNHLADYRGKVLLFDPTATWYFGADGQELPPILEHLAASGQGHRVNFRKNGDLEALIDWLAEIGPASLNGQPRDGWEGPGCSPPSKKSNKGKCGSC